MLHGMPDEVFNCILPHINDPKDRDAVSLVCHSWYDLEALTRKKVTIPFCYTTTPDRVRRRFPHLESLKVKGKPRAAMFNLIPHNWGGYVTPWINEIAVSFDCLKFIHFRRMIVRDLDLELLSRTRGHVVQSLKLDKCSGFSTDGLLYVTRSCRNLTTFFLEESLIIEKDGEWLHELAMHNSSLETLNFYTTELSKVDFLDLELIARKCRSLTSLKTSECEILNLLGSFRNTSTLEELCGGSFDEEPIEDAPVVSFPRSLRSLGLSYMGKNELSVMLPHAHLLTKLDLLYAFLDTEDHCQLIQMCPNLEILAVRCVIGDRGLEILAQHCKRLTRLRIGSGGGEQEIEDEEGVITQRGLIALAQGCQELDNLAVYVSDITNASLESVGRYLKKLLVFRLCILNQEKIITDLPLDNGVRSLLIGCKNLERFALYLRHGGLTDEGLGYIGQYSPKITCMLLGFVGESDEGILNFSRGCPTLRKLEMRGCRFSERALAIAATQLTALRYLWVQGYVVGSSSGHDLLTMARPFWNIEIIPNRQVDGIDPNSNKIVVNHLGQILAYYSLVGTRTDFPETVVPL